MKNAKTWLTAGVCIALIATITSATYSIPEDQVDVKKILWGNASAFDKPAEVQVDTVIRSTPEYDEIVKNKIERGTGKYWILLSQATDRCMQAISEVGDETDYDLVAAQGYLGSLDPPITGEDITETVLAKLEEK